MDVTAVFKVSSMPSLKRIVDAIYTFVFISWAVFFVGMLASFGLVIAGMAYGTAATIAGSIFIAGAFGFGGGMFIVSMGFVAGMLGVHVRRLHALRAGALQ